MIEEIFPRIFRVEIPLPNNPLKATNSYVLTSDDRNLIIDTGFNRKECMDAMQAGLKELDVDLTRTDFFVTHLHADHQGLVASLAAPDARTYMGDEDARHMESGGGFHKMTEHGAFSGFPAEELENALFNHPGFKHGPQRPLTWTHVKEGDVVTVNGYRLECVETPGHTWGHVCLYEPERKVFFSGDHILGDITPNIQAWVGDEDPLAAYIQSLSKIEAMEVSMVLPGHRSLIPNSRKRIRGLKQHHLARCNEVLDILRGGAQSAYQTAAQMTWDIRADRWEDFPLMQKWFATGEAIAHLRFLENRGLTEKKLNPQGVFLYTLTNEDARLETVD